MDYTGLGSKCSSLLKLAKAFGRSYRLNGDAWPEHWVFPMGGIDPEGKEEMRFNYLQLKLSHCIMAQFIRHTAVSQHKTHKDNDTVQIYF